MNRKILVLILIAIFLLISIGFGIVFALNSNNYTNLKDDKVLIEKAEQEIKFLEDKIIAMMNKLNNINFLNTVFTEEKKSNKNQGSAKENEINEEQSQTQKSESSSKSSGETEEKTSMGGEESSSINSQFSNGASSNENTKYEVKNGGILASNDNDEIDWEYMKTNIEEIYTILPTIITDLNMLDVNSESILNFSNSLDQTTLSIKNEDKLVSLNNLASLYAFLPNYRNQFSKDNQKINIDYTVNCILNSYVFVEQNNWNEVKAQLTNAINYYSAVMDGINENVQNQNRISKAYILLNELNSCINFQDTELFYIKYRNVIEELVNLKK